MTNILYKVTGPKGEAPYHTGFIWPKPKGKSPGKWQHSEGELELCSNGLHACENPVDVLRHIRQNGFKVWEAECKGEKLSGDSKVVVSSLRLVAPTLLTAECVVAFAADVADRALQNIGNNIDPRSWNAVFASRARAKGEISAWSAASAVSASESAARSAVSAAWSAAVSAAESAAVSAAWSAVSAAESAAESAVSAARSAAWSAVGAADSAAWSVASAASAESARSAAAESAVSAVSAEKQWQNKRLLQYVQHGLDAMSMSCEGWRATEGEYDGV